MADESPEMFGKQTIAALLDFDWSGLGDWHEARDDGIRAVPPAADDPHLETPGECEYFRV